MRLFLPDNTPCDRYSAVLYMCRAIFLNDIDMINGAWCLYKDNLHAAATRYYVQTKTPLYAYNQTDFDYRLNRSIGQEGTCDEYTCHEALMCYYSGVDNLRVISQRSLC